MDIMKAQIINDDKEVVKTKRFEVGKNLIRTSAKFDPSEIIDLNEEENDNF